MSDKVVAELQEPTPAVGDGGPDMIQLLTPEGQRVSHPDYDKYVADLTPEDLARIAGIAASTSLR